LKNKVKHSNFHNQISNVLNVEENIAATILKKALEGNECSDKTIETWIHEKLIPFSVTIDENGYKLMCIDALKIVGKTVATDFGSSRQRDFGQLWADLTRGYLGEYAAKIFLKNKFKMDVELGHNAGKLENFLQSDISLVKDSNGVFRKPRINIGIKTIKWNGIWFDIPNAQFNHSDFQICVKLGTERDHLFSFFKSIGIFKDIILKIGTEINSLTKSEASEIYNSIPDFKPIGAYICGFIKVNSNFKELNYKGSKGKKHFTINEWHGPIKSGDLEKIKNIEGISNGNIKFKNIGEFSHENGYLFNTGTLNYNWDEWNEMIQKI